jgi:transposase
MPEVRSGCRLWEFRGVVADLTSMHDESPPPPLHLTAETRSALEALLGRHSAAQSLVRRARIVLMSADGASAARIGVALGCSERVVRKWRARFRSDPRLASLADRPRSGRPARVAVATRCRLVKLACERPSDTTPFREVWTYRTLAEALHAATGVRVSVSEVGRILRFDELRPHRVQQWLHSPDPEFAAKAERICDLYLTPRAGAVVCVDEKPLILHTRKHPTRYASESTRPSSILRRTAA